MPLSPWRRSTFSISHGQKRVTNGSHGGDNTGHGSSGRFVEAGRGVERQVVLQVLNPYTAASDRPEFGTSAKLGGPLPKTHPVDSRSGPRAPRRPRRRPPSRPGVHIHHEPGGGAKSDVGASDRGGR